MSELPAYPIASVDNALRLIEALQRGQPLRVTDVAAELGVAASTAHRLLAMLCYRGFACRGSDEHLYQAGPALRRTSSVRLIGDLRTAVRPFLQQLSTRTGETAHLVIRVEAEVQFIESIEGTKPGHIGSRAGAAMPAHRTSGGQAMLADLSLTELRRLYPDGVPSKDGQPAEDLYLRLAAVRRRGFGLVDRAYEKGVTAVGAAVRIAACELQAALCISVPSTRSSEARVWWLARELLQTVAGVGERSGRPAARSRPTEGTGALVGYGAALPAAHG
jgi:IclR family acetate operon transcriptional repressor